jgi:hypothetical protein
MVEQEKTKSKERELSEKCPVCGQATVEETFNFQGKNLAVCVCTGCPFFDWIVPTIKGHELSDEEPYFLKSEEWAKAKADELREKLGLVIVPIHFSENVKEVVSRKGIDSRLSVICHQFGYKQVYVGKFGRGIRIEMS